MTPLDSPTMATPNQALKLTRLWACQLGGPCSAENAAMHWPCTQSAVQLSAGVSRQVGGSEWTG
jgi:hypothetical protein